MEIAVLMRSVFFF